MRRVRYSVAASLDGFIAGAAGEYDWIPEEPGIDFQAFLRHIDTVVMGRKSFETVTAAGGLGFLPDVPVFVFSGTLDPADVPAATVIREDPTRFVRELERTEAFPSGIILNRYRVRRGPTQELSSATGGIDG